MSVADLASLLDAFVTWLVLHEHDTFESCSLSPSFPLALWLSSELGFACGVDHGTYGCLSWDIRDWQHLPRWAIAFVDAVEGRYGYRPITGEQAFDILAHIEAPSLAA